MFLPVDYVGGQPSTALRLVAIEPAIDDESIVRFG
jgi:hypothetical protein